MTKTRRLFAGLTVVLASWLTVGSAHAQIAHTWVSSTGSGTACTRTAPCANFFTAQAATNAGGVISVLDPGEYNAVVITKSLIIRAEGVDGGGAVTPINTVDPWMVVIAGASDVVTLEGIHLTVRAASGSIPEGTCTSSDVSSQMATAPLIPGSAFSRTARAN